MLTELLWKIFLISIGLTVISKLIFRQASTFYLFAAVYIVVFVVFILVIQIEAIIEKIRSRKKGRDKRGLS